MPNFEFRFELIGSNSEEIALKAEKIITEAGFDVSQFEVEIELAPVFDMAERIRCWKGDVWAYPSKSYDSSAEMNALASPIRTPRWKVGI